jgi:peptidoglycan/LPS O-acetylase OafA/YrhL
VYSPHLRAPGAILNCVLLQYLGRISYSTYLFHVPVITLVQRSVWTTLHPTSRLQLFAWTAVGAVTATVIVSVVGWHFVERPFLRLGRAAGPNRPNE